MSLDIAINADIDLDALFVGIAIQAILGIH
jgi:hypothetical protein